MGKTKPVRVDRELLGAAQLAGALAGRSASQQLNRWARIGREIEAAQGVSQGDIAVVLTGRGSYDHLTSEEQAVVRAVWATQIEEARRGLNLKVCFESDGRSYVELGDDGSVVVHDPARRSRR